jgi:DMSO/TMAO reductase YedYZ molybdopterin-dependent catalytic subunit
MNPNPRSRRAFLAGCGSLGLVPSLELIPGLRIARASPQSQTTVDLPFGNGRREIATDYPQKGPMIVQRNRPPLLETPFEVFDRGVFTPNDRFYVRWHLANVPTTIDTGRFRLTVAGTVRRPLSLSLDELTHEFEPFELAAVNQCSGNSRGFFSPRVVGGEWGNGAMGNALWRGVRLKEVLDRAGVRAGALAVRFQGLDTGVLPQTPNFLKSLALDHARDGEVMIAYAMNGEHLPLLNGFPLRLVVPGWYATYWVKMLHTIEVLDQPDENFWMSKAYLIPDTPGANMRPGEKGVRMVPINRMLPRSFITSLTEGESIPRGRSLTVRGIAFGGDSGVARVLASVDDGHHWHEAQLGANHGKYSFREWRFAARFATQGERRIKVRAVNTAGASQPSEPNWNAGGYMRNVIESVSVKVA